MNDTKNMITCTYSDSLLSLSKETNEQLTFIAQESSEALTNFQDISKEKATVFTKNIKNEFDAVSKDPSSSTARKQIRYLNAQMKQIYEITGKIAILIG